MFTGFPLLFSELLTADCWSVRGTYLPRFLPSFLPQGSKEDPLLNVTAAASYHSSERGKTATNNSFKCMHKAQKNIVTHFCKAFLHTELLRNVFAL